MKRKHRDNYAFFFCIGEQDCVMCEVCQNTLMDHVHHILYRSQGGGDEIENCIGLCYTCHKLAHKKKLTADFLIRVHNFQMDEHERTSRASKIQFLANS